MPAAEERGCAPPLMFGRLQNNELVWALSSTGRCWQRQKHETAEVFEARIVRDLLEQKCGVRVSVLVE
jgi:hypothetical protein